MGGWEPREFHEYIYEGDRLVGAVVTREPEWNPDQVAIMRAHLANEAERGAHGFLMSEATDPVNEHAFVGSPIPRVDFVEKARLDAQKAYYDEWDRPENPVNRHGHLFTVRRADAPTLDRPSGT